MGLTRECVSLTATPFPKCSYPIQNASPQDSLSDHIVEVHRIRCFLQSKLRAISSVAGINGHSGRKTELITICVRSTKSAVWKFHILLLKDRPDTACHIYGTVGAKPSVSY